MKRNLAIVLSILLISTSAYALKPFSYVFSGRWQPAENPLLVDESGFQDIQNLRNDGRRLKGVSGHTKTTAGVVDSTYMFIRNGFHFTKDQPQESHVIVYAEDSTNSAARIYQNTTAIPDVGDFSATPLSTPASGYGISRFSPGPQGTMIHANGVESQVWGGDEFRVGAFITATTSVTASAVTNPKDQTVAVLNTSSATGSTVTIAAASDKVFLVGSTRPLKGIIFAVSSANTGTPSLTGKEWDGSSWTSLGTMVDGTSGLKTSGEITFDSTLATSKLKHLEGRILYWYQFELSAGTAEISYVTVDAEWQDIQNIWDLTESIPAAIMFGTGSTFEDWTDEGIVNETGSVVVLDSMTSSQTLNVGFLEPQQGVILRVVATKENSNASVLTVKYNTGTAWAAVSDLVDGTVESSTTIAKTGTITWAAVAVGTEFKTTILGGIPLYFYQLTVSDTFDSEVEVYFFSGIPVPEKIAAYVFPAFFQNRVVLFNEAGGDQNKIRYSVQDSPDIWNGPDSGEEFIGDEKAIIAAGVLYNIFSTEAGLQQLIIFKQHAIYRMVGTGPDDWDIKLITDSVGCAAPLSVIQANVRSAEGQMVQVLVWQADTGVYMTSGADVQNISDDIKNYWDQQQDEVIASDRMDNSVGGYDSELNAYKLLASSGSGQSTHNLELEYSLSRGGWTKIFRENSSGANPYQAFFQVIDTDGNAYSYGATDEGFVYRTEHGTTWAGEEIIEFVKTKDLLLDEFQPFLSRTKVRYFRLSFEDKDGAASLDFLLTATGDFLRVKGTDRLIIAYGEQIAVTHYCDTTETEGGDKYQHTVFPVNISSGPFNSQDVQLGPCISHAFKFEADITNLTDGLEMTGMGLLYETEQTFFID